MTRGQLTGLLVVVAVLVVAWAARRAQRFGGFSAAFSRRDKLQRAELSSAQDALRGLLRQRDAQLAPQRKAAEASVAAYRTRVQSAQAQLDAARDPGPGAVLDRLGPVELHEHVLVLHGRPAALAGLQVSVRTTPRMSALVVQFPDGQRTSVPFSTEWQQDAQGRPHREFDDGRVQLLSDAIHNALLAEQRFRALQPQHVAAAVSNLERQAADTSLMAEELARYADACLEAPSTDAALAAHERLCALEDAWVDRLAGRTTDASSRQPTLTP